MVTHEMEELDNYPATRNGCDVPDDMSSFVDGCHERPDSSVGHVLVVCFVYGPIVFVTVVGNVLVIVAFVCDPAIRCRVSNLFILNLSVADLLIGSVCMSGNFVWLLTDDWTLGMTPCLLYLIVDFVSSYMSVLAVVLISLDRYRLVTLKLKYVYIQTRRRALVSISCCWCFCLVFYPVIIIGWSAVTGQRNVDYSVNCDVEFYGNIYLNVSLILLEFVIPLAILIYLNGTLYCVIRRRAKGFRWNQDREVRTVSTGKITLSTRGKNYPDTPPNGLPTEASTDSSLETVGGCTTPRVNETGVPAEEDEGNIENAVASSLENCHAEGRSVSVAFYGRQSEYLKHRKAAVTLSLIVGVYALCWLPFYVKNTIVTFCGPIDSYIEEVLDNLLWCNSTINPFLYALLNPRFRRFFKSTFRRVCCCRCRCP